MKKINVIMFFIVVTALGGFYLWRPEVKTENKSKILPKMEYQKHLGMQVTIMNQANRNLSRGYVQKGDSLFEISLAREALEEWRLSMEQSLQENRDKLDQEWEKLKTDRERLENEKEEFAAAVKLGLCKPNDQQKTETDKDEDAAFQKKQKHLNSLSPADPEQFEGLNSSIVHQKYPGITFLPEYRLRKFVDPIDMNMGGMQGNPKIITDMDDVQAEERFYELVTKLHVDCVNVERQGNRGDGGWDLCMSHPYTPRYPCIVYSFGINNDFTFDDAMSYRYNCDVRSFDPSMTIGDHKHSNKVWFYQLGLGNSNTVNNQGWKLETLGSIMGKCGHLKKTIDVLKIDIDYSEWSCFGTLYKEGVLKNIKQLVLEVHTPEVYLINKPSTREDFYSMYDVLLDLELQGFRRFSVRYNIHGQYLSQRSGKHRTCCYELSYVNIKYLKS